MGLNNLWHEIDCPTLSNQMGREEDCNCLFKAAEQNIKLTRQAERDRCVKILENLWPKDGDGIDCFLEGYCRALKIAIKEIKSKKIKK